MFNFFKKKSNGVEVDAAVDGKIMPITDVKDDVFSTKMLGDGYAIKPSDGHVYAPIGGTISTLFPTKHAIGITTEQGLEVLIHLGLDTVELKGAPFTVNIKKGDKVKRGDSLATMDIKMITDKGYDDSAIVVYTNMKLLKSVSTINSGQVTHGQKVQTIEFN
ncbi:PTS sugar transporter subunit IIA [Lactobacillus acetotolerans]|jgi:PTS system glucose-specific IIA component|uniref:PTS sugar transporter subunit IIA n=1 Tax=Lactobacillus acetotolerans TaxID=1600 RepID=UPI000EEB1434|nr:PTS glucose transporter subunit IIA [Lactobacillus acetotolerans]HCX39812.1 PTS glucose transporter subunit IIABC [Lactobacillus acetotolerans]